MPLLRMPILIRIVRRIFPAQAFYLFYLCRAAILLTERICCPLQNRLLPNRPTSCLNMWLREQYEY